MSSAAERAGRLSASLLLLGLVREPAVSAVTGAKESGLLTAAEWEAWCEMDDEDDALMFACLAVERELRARQFGCLELLLHVSSAPDAVFPPGDAAGTGSGTAPAEALTLAPRAAVEAVAVLVLGWHLPPPEGADA